MKQLLVENCILLNDELFQLDGKPYTVKHFLELLKGRGMMRTVKKKILHVYGKRFENKDEVLSYITGVAHSLLGIGG